MVLAGDCPSWSPADLAAVVPGGGRALFVARLPCLGFTFLPPIPPAPARRALFPGGEGGVFLFSYARGFAPCIPGTEPEAARAEPAVQVPGGVVRFLCRLPTLPSAYFPAPIPPAPFPAGRGGFFLFSYARGFAPCIPGTEPEAALMQGANHVPGGGACLPCCRLTLPLWCPAGGLNPSGTCSPCPGGEDHLKRRRRLRRIVPSPPVPPSPWLPALPMERRFFRFCAEPQAPMRRAPAWQVL